MKSVLVILSALLLTLPARADEFAPTFWSEGLHLLAGGGVNSALYTSTQDREDGGMGLNFKTDLLYVLHPDWALEWSANVKFNRIRSYLLWDTLLTVGVRTQLPAVLPDSWGAPYARVFVGRAPTVLFLNGETNERISDPSVSRIHFDGPVAGLGVGVKKKNREGRVWFTELSFSAQSLEQEEDVRMEGEVPLVVASRSSRDNANIYSFFWTFGILAF